MASAAGQTVLPAHDLPQIIIENYLTEFQHLQRADTGDWIELFAECPSCEGLHLASFLKMTEVSTGGYAWGCRCPAPGPLSIDYEYARTPRLIDAYTSARQARFEHGQNGYTQFTPQRSVHQRLTRIDQPQANAQHIRRVVQRMELLKILEGLHKFGCELCGTTVWMSTEEYEQLDGLVYCEPCTDYINDKIDHA